MLCNNAHGLGRDAVPARDGDEGHMGLHCRAVLSAEKFVIISHKGCCQGSDVVEGLLLEDCIALDHCDGRVGLARERLKSGQLYRRHEAWVDDDFRDLDIKTKCEKGSERGAHDDVYSFVCDVLLEKCKSLCAVFLWIINAKHEKILCAEYFAQFLRAAA